MPFNTKGLAVEKSHAKRFVAFLRDALYGMVDFFCSFYTPLDFLSRKGACFNFQFEAFGGHKLFVRKEETK